MPQMAPINWLFLFIIFSMSLIIFNISNYFSFFTQPPKTMDTEKKNTQPMNWKW